MQKVSSLMPTPVGYSLRATEPTDDSSSNYKLFSYNFEIFEVFIFLNVYFSVNAIEFLTCNSLCLSFEVECLYVNA